MRPPDDNALAILFRSARSHSYSLDRPVIDNLLHELYDLMKWGPTSANYTPARLVFVRAPQAQECLRPCLAGGNVNRSMTAPVGAIIGMDLEFGEKLPKLFPHKPEARAWLEGKSEKIFVTAFRNSSRQGA